ncbi:MAG: hypothetical protein AYK23_04205 [Candidatus Proteinoplasmatales archaeon SG8-5]|nr:MAG: hypothetical protein AYK23_04205 [Candidatus Proteinoplasmatales archaeon SG8-5]
MNVLYATLRAMARATEDEDRVGEVLRFASGVDEVVKTAVKDHFGNRTVVLSVDIRKKRDIRAFLKRLSEADILKILADEIEERTDDGCVLHFRLEKQGAFEGRLVLAVSKDVVDCALKAAAYPAKKETAVASLRETFQELLSS